MKKIILFPGQIVSPFFENEISYIKKNFEIIAIFSYDTDVKKAKEILIRNQISKDKLFISSKFYWNILKIIRWLFIKDVRDEIKECCISKKNVLKKIFYLIFYGTYALDVEEKIRNLKIDIDDKEDLFFYSFWMSRGAYAINYIKSKKDWNCIKTITRAHGYDLYIERNNMHYLPFREFINQYTDKICFISELGKKYFEEKYPNGKNKYVYHLGVSNKKNLLKEIKESKKQICIASCSAVVHVKRIDYIIDLLSNIDGISIKWIHIGDGELLNDMKDLASKKLEKTSIEYEFLGNIENSKILEIYIEKDVDFFINSSDSEGIPVSIMEAISVGIPVIARNVGGISEIVNSSTGLLLNQKWNKYNYKTVKEFISFRLNNICLYKKYIENCIEVYEKEYCAEKNYIDFFKSFGE